MDDPRTKSTEPQDKRSTSSQDSDELTTKQTDPGAAISSEAVPSENASSQFRPARVVMASVALCAVLGIGAAGWIFGLNEQIAYWLRPPLVPVAGQVFFEGKPVPSGLIQTLPLDGQPMGAIGQVQEDGRFTLQTQVNGRYVEGAYVGRHKLAVGYGKQKMLGIIPLVPEKYFTLGDTVLNIDVNEDAKENHFEFQLEGELTEEALRVLGRLPSTKTPREEANGESVSNRQRRDEVDSDEASSEEASIQSDDASPDRRGDLSNLGSLSQDN